MIPIFEHGIVTSSAVLGSAYAISAKSKNADACLKFLELLDTDTKLADLYVYGIEGEDYTRDADGIVTRVENPGWKMDVWCSVNVMAPSLSNTDAKDKKEQYTKMNDEAVETKLMGFRPDFTAVTSEMAAINSVVNEQGWLFEAGFSDPDTALPTFLADLKTAQIDTIIAELQKQYDEWLKTKK